MTDTITYRELVDWGLDRRLLAADEKPTATDLRMVLRAYVDTLRVSVGYTETQK